MMMSRLKVVLNDVLKVFQGDACKVKVGKRLRLKVVLIDAVKTKGGSQ